ncbi:MAG: hypothetical protein KGI33_08870 [Thaumarchaeota archaeon]|nr:hypothetical protein [Nitrososphaerota archaeon]
MLTNSERRFVENPGQFSKKRQRTFRCRINKKIRKFGADLWAISEKNVMLGLDLKPVSGFSGIGELQNSEALKKTKKDSEDKKDFLLDALENW